MEKQRQSAFSSSIGKRAAKEHDMKDEAKAKGYQNSLFGRNVQVTSDDLYREFTYRELEFSMYEYVPFLTACNNLLDVCYAALMTSPVNSAIIKTKVNWLIGDEFKTVPLKSRFTENASLPSDAQLMALEEWMDLQNPEGETLEDIYRKVTFDFVVYGNAFVEFVRSSSGGVKVFVQRSIPFADCRVGKLKEGEYEPSVVGISKYWIEDEITPTNVRTVSLYPNWTLMEDGTERSIYQIKNYHPNFQYYGVPDYVAGMLHFENDYQIAKFNNSRFQNGFAPSMIATFYGDYTPDEAQKFATDLESVYTGTGSNSKMFISVLANKEDAPDITITNDRHDGEFLQLSQITAQGIVTAHRFTMALAGFATAGLLGTNQQMRTEYEITYNNVILPMLNELLRWVNTSVKECEDWTGQNFGTNLGVKQKSLVSFINDIPVAQVMERDEMREKLGLPKLNQETPIP